MKVLQIGAGRWGINHLRVLTGLQVDVYLAEISEEQRRKCLEMGLPPDRVTDDYRVFLDRVAAVDVVTPVSTHFPLGREIIAHRQDLFMEKPMAETVEEAETLARLARAAQVVLQVGHIFRFDPAAEFIKGYLASGALGAVQTLCGVFSGFKQPRADGGVTISDAIHFIDFFNYLLDRPPTRVLARCEDILGRGMDDMAWIWMDFDGKSAVVEANYFTPDKKRLITVTGEKGTLVCDFASSQDKIKIHRNRHILDNDTWKTVSGEVIHREVNPAEPLWLELRAFLECVRGRSRPLADAQCGVDAMKIVEAALRSHREGRMLPIH